MFHMGQTVQYVNVCRISLGRVSSVGHHQFAASVAGQPDMRCATLFDQARPIALPQMMCLLH